MTATTGLILALDLCKFKSVACVYDRANPTGPRFDSATTSRHHVRQLLAKYRPP